MASHPDLLIVRLNANPQVGSAFAGAQVIPSGSTLRLLAVNVIGANFGGGVYMLSIREKNGNFLRLPDAATLNAGVSGRGIYVPLTAANTYWTSPVPILLPECALVPASMDFEVLDQAGARTTFTEIYIFLDVLRLSDLPAISTDPEAPNKKRKLGI